LGGKENSNSLELEIYQTFLVNLRLEMGRSTATLLLAITVCFDIKIGIYNIRLLSARHFYMGVMFYAQPQNAIWTSDERICDSKI
jgi:hypothetical protein